MIRSLDELRRKTMAAGSPTRERIVQPGGGGGGSVPGATVALFRVQSQGNDTITCRRIINGVDDTTDVSVAKPWNLRRTPFDGEERNGISYEYTSASERTATRTSDSETEDQVVVPAWVAASEDWDGDCIQAVEADTGLSGVEWLEISERAWAAVEPE